LAGPAQDHRHRCVVLLLVEERTLQVPQLRSLELLRGDRAPVEIGGKQFCGDQQPCIGKIAVGDDIGLGSAGQLAGDRPRHHQSDAASCSA
jgi:hypothetical protein